jgi:hypothetical protein
MKRRKRSVKITWLQTWPIWLTFAVLFGLGVFGVLLLVSGTRIPTKVLAEGEDVDLVARDLQRGEPRVLAVGLGSTAKTEFFIERGAGNDLTVAFASCRKCYRSGHYRQGNALYCGRCNEPMLRLSRTQTPPQEIDCTHIPIPVERIGDNVIVRANAVRNAFVQWYAPTISKDAPMGRNEVRNVSSNRFTGNANVSGYCYRNALGAVGCPAAVPDQEGAESSHRFGTDG